MIVMSWNLCYQPYFEGTINWGTRLDIILHKIKEINPDILLLQEVDLKNVPDFQPLTNYQCVSHVVCKKRTNPMGNAILFRKEFVLLNLTLKTRAVHVKLQIKDQVLHVCNVHLSAGLYRNEWTRLQEIQSCLKVIGSEHNVIVGGDFNDDFHNPLGLHFLLCQFQSLKEKQPTCLTGERYMRFDHLLHHFDYQELPLPIDMTIPNLIIPSDHLPLIHVIRFETKQ